MNDALKELKEIWHKKPHLIAIPVVLLLYILSFLLIR